MPAGEIKDKAAWDATERWRESALAAGQNIMWESVFSHPGRLDEIRKAHKLGYFVIVVYITTISPIINIKRVKIRVMNGGHGVPTEKILARYDRSISLLPELLILSDEAYVYDNSEATPVLTFYKRAVLEETDIIHSGKVEYFRLNENEVGTQRHAWVSEYIVRHLEERGFIINSC